MNPRLPDYVVVSTDQNPEYKNLVPFIKERWNMLGIKFIFLNVKTVPYNIYNENIHKCMHGNIENILPVSEDQDGNMEFEFELSNLYPDDLERYFHFMVLRFFICTKTVFKDKLMLISDGDLIPINKYYISDPSYPYDMNELYKGDILCTNSYQDGRPMATYTYGLGSSFAKAFSEMKTMVEVEKDALHWMRHIVCTRYKNDEHYMNYRYQESQSIYVVLKNRMQGREGDMTTLRAHMIDLIDNPQQLNFLELHNIRYHDSLEGLNREERDQALTPERWEKLKFLLNIYDGFNIYPSNYFYETIIDPWRDTLITKDGQLILGDEY